MSFHRRIEAIQWGATQQVYKENLKRPVIIAATWYFVEPNKTDAQKVHSVKFHFFFYQVQEQTKRNCRDRSQNGGYFCEGGLLTKKGSREASGGL